MNTVAKGRFGLGPFLQGGVKPSPQKGSWRDVPSILHPPEATLAGVPDPRYLESCPVPHPCVARLSMSRLLGIWKTQVPSDRRRILGKLVHFCRAYSLRKAEGGISVSQLCKTGFPEGRLKFPVLCWSLLLPFHPLVGVEDQPSHVSRTRSQVKNRGGTPPISSLEPVGFCICHGTVLVNASSICFYIKITRRPSSES